MENNFLVDMDNEFQVTKVSTQAKQLIAALAVLGVSILVGCLYFFNYYRDYNATYDKVSEISQVQGNAVEDTDLAGISNLIDSYFDAMGGENVTILNGFSESGSVFADSMAKARASVVTSYDEYDSYIRGMGKVASAYGVSSVNDVIEKDGRYYAYITVSAPDVVDFLYSFEADLAQYFTSKGVTKEILMKHVYELMDRYEITTNEKPMVLELVRTADGSFQIVSDADILDMVTGSYNTLVDEAVRVAKLALAKEQY